MTLEIVYIALPVLISTGFSIFPYVKKAMVWLDLGAGYDYCEPSGFVIQMAFFSLYVSVGVVEMAASLVFVVIYFKMSKESRHLLKKTLCIVVFQLIHILHTHLLTSSTLWFLVSRSIHHTH